MNAPIGFRSAPDGHKSCTLVDYAVAYVLGVSALPILGALLQFIVLPLSGGTGGEEPTQAMVFALVFQASPLITWLGAFASLPFMLYLVKSGGFGPLSAALLGAAVGIVVTFILGDRTLYTGVAFGAFIGLAVWFVLRWRRPAVFPI